MNIVNIILFVFALFHGVSVVVSIPINTPSPQDPQKVLDLSFDRVTRTQEGYNKVNERYHKAVQDRQSAAWNLETAGRNTAEAMKKQPGGFTKKLPFKTKNTRKALDNISSTTAEHHTAEHEYKKAKKTEESLENERNIHLGKVEEARRKHADELRYWVKPHQY